MKDLVHSLEHLAGVAFFVAMAGSYFLVQYFFDFSPVREAILSIAVLGDFVAIVRLKGWSEAGLGQLVDMRVFSLLFLGVAIGLGVVLRIQKPSVPNEKMGPAASRTYTQQYWLGVLAIVLGGVTIVFFDIDPTISKVFARRASSDGILGLYLIILAFSCYGAAWLAVILGLRRR